MSRIPMAVASTLVVLAALGVAHLIVFSASSAVVEASPPETVPAVHPTTPAAAAPAYEAASTSARPRVASAAVRALYHQARAQIQSQTRGPATVRQCSGEAADVCAKNVEACTKECQAECIGISFCGPTAIQLEVIRGVKIEGCGDDEECCNECPAVRTAEAKKIDDFAASDEFPLGRIVAGVTTWFRTAKPESCPLCPVGKTCPACAEECEEGKEVARPVATVKANSGAFRGVTDSVTKGKSVDSDNCPGADGRKQLHSQSSEDELRDRALADQIGAIEEVRRERKNHLLQGTLLEGADENEAFSDALRLVAGFTEGETAPSAPPATIPPDFGGQDYVPEHQGASDPALVDVLRHASRLLDHKSHDLEELGRYDEADHLRGLAQAIRQEARKASGSEGGCGLFCPAAAAKAMCAPSSDRTAIRRSTTVPEGPVRK